MEQKIYTYNQGKSLHSWKRNQKYFTRNGITFVVSWLTHLPLPHLLLILLEASSLFLFLQAQNTHAYTLNFLWCKSQGLMAWRLTAVLQCKLFAKGTKYSLDNFLGIRKPAWQSFLASIVPSCSVVS